MTHRVRTGCNVLHVSSCLSIKMTHHALPCAESSEIECSGLHLPRVLFRVSRFGDFSLIDRVPSSELAQNSDKYRRLNLSEQEKGLHSSLLYPSNSSEFTHAFVCLDSYSAPPCHTPYTIPLLCWAFIVAQLVTLRIIFHAQAHTPMRAVHD